MRRYLVNTLNLKLGGAYQRAVSFIKNINKHKNIEFHLFATNSFLEEFDSEDICNLRIYRFENNHTDISFSSIIVWIKMHLTERKIKPDVTFSFVGPAYFFPKSIHLVGFGLPQLIYSNKFTDDFSTKSKLIFQFKEKITRIEANAYVSQTEEVSEKLKTIGGINKKYFVVKNGVGNQFDSISRIIRKNSHFSGRKIVLVSGYRDNKNFEIIPEIIRELQREEFKVTFHLTLDDNTFNRLFKDLTPWVINHGKVNPRDLPELYSSMSLLFLPSFLECFSASYCEAMFYGIPIITSNYSFARNICDDSAEYFNPYDAKEAASKIIKLFSNELEYFKYSNKSFEKFQEYPNLGSQSKSYVNILNSL